MLILKYKNTPFFDIIKSTKNIISFYACHAHGGGASAACVDRHGCLI